ncbi:MAG: DUF2911 domain-containing protein [Gemmatimonadales bacterium]|jgi:hypothetical protein
MAKTASSFISLALLALPAAVPAQVSPDSATFVTRLGDDTLVIERFVHRPDRIEADVLMRVPRTTMTRYELVLSDDGRMQRMRWMRHAPATPDDTLAWGAVANLGDSLAVQTVTERGDRSVTIAADPSTLPFIDMVHWPYELALMRAKAAGVDEMTVPLLSGTRIAPFRFGVMGADSMTITHPTRGTMRVRVDEAGRLLALDAGATTRKLMVERRAWTSLAETARRWAAADAAGRGMGALSGRGVFDADIAGATIALDYGTPSKRGRTIWGGLVPYGAVWRTGANRATHFSTDRDLVFGSGDATLAVPAGEYTLFSIPAADGGVLIINRQTGQTGTAYDHERDLGRVPLNARPLDEEVEVFTIIVTETEDGGLLRLQWDRTELVVPFRVGG